MGDKPRFSVVMPVYNRESSVRHAIQSILDQTVDDWELIVVDDGSTDGTADVVRQFSDKDSRIRLFNNKKNRGISYTRNKGNREARGDIIVVQDSDDMSFPDRLEEVGKVFDQLPNTDVLYHWFYVRCIDIHYGMRAVHREIHRCGEYDRKRALSTPYIPGQLAYRKEVAKKCPYRLEMRSWDDWMFIVDATMNNFTFFELRKPLYEYVISDDSITTLSNGTDLRDREHEAMVKIMNEEYHLNVT